LNCRKAAGAAPPTAFCAPQGFSTRCEAFSKGLKWPGQYGKFAIMKIGTIDQESRIRLAGASPKDKFWVIEEPDGYRLRRIVPPEGRLSKAEVIRRIRASKLTFTRDWDEIRKDTREP